MQQDGEPPFVLSSNLTETISEGENFLIEEVGDSEIISKLRRGLKKKWHSRYDLVVTTTSEKGKLKLSMSHSEPDIPTQK